MLQTFASLLKGVKMIGREMIKTNDSSLLDYISLVIKFI